jgi:predicted nucleic acid-binding protein
MQDDIIVDASVAAKLYFIDQGTPQAKAELTTGASLFAPELLFIEIASVATNMMRRGLSTTEQAAMAVASVLTLLDEAVPMSGLSRRAFDLASRHGFSAYDASYLALAEQRAVPLLTADARLTRRAQDQGLAHLVRLLDQGPALESRTP